MKCWFFSGIYAIAVLIALTGCSKDPLELSPIEARKALVELGYAVDEGGFYQAVRLIDVHAAKLFLAAGFDKKWSASVLEAVASEKEFASFIKEHNSEESFRELLTVLFKGKLTPTSELTAAAQSGDERYRYGTSLWLISLRLGLDDFREFLLQHEGNWHSAPGEESLTLPAYILYLSTKVGDSGVWGIEEALRTIDRYLATGKAPEGYALSQDRFFQAVIGFHKYYWSEHNNEVRRLWLEAGSPPWLWSEPPHVTPKWYHVYATNRPSALGCLIESSYADCYVELVVEEKEKRKVRSQSYTPSLLEETRRAAMEVLSRRAEAASACISEHGYAWCQENYDPENLDSP